jgi:hypothetical protein
MTFMDCSQPTTTSKAEKSTNGIKSYGKTVPVSQLSRCWKQHFFHMVFHMMWNWRFQWLSQGIYRNTTRGLTRPLVRYLFYNKHYQSHSSRIYSPEFWYTRTLPNFQQVPKLPYNVEPLKPEIITTVILLLYAATNYFHNQVLHNFHESIITTIWSKEQIFIFDQKSISTVYIPLTTTIMFRGNS